MLITLTLACTGIARADDLAKASQNPIGDMVSLPFELWHYDGMPGDSSATALMVKPVLPVNLGEVNLINRLIVPYLGVDANFSRLELGYVEVPPSDVDRDGFGNVQYQGFLTSAEPGKVIWGAGPVLALPTNTNEARV